MRFSRHLVAGESTNRRRSQQKQLREPVWRSCATASGLEVPESAARFGLALPIASVARNCQVVSPLHSSVHSNGIKCGALR